MLQSVCVRACVRACVCVCVCVWVRVCRGWAGCLNERELALPQLRRLLGGIRPVLLHDREQRVEILADVVLDDRHDRAELLEEEVQQIRLARADQLQAPSPLADHMRRRTVPMT